MSPLLIFILVVLFIAGGLLLLRDTAFLSGKPKKETRQDGNGGAIHASSDSGAARTDKNTDTRNGDVDASTDGGDGGGD